MELGPNYGIHLNLSKTFLITSTMGTLILPSLLPQDYAHLQEAINLLVETLADTTTCKITTCVRLLVGAPLGSNGTT
jgi:hypothetical protein